MRSSSLRRHDLRRRRLFTLLRDPNTQEPMRRQPPHNRLFSTLLMCGVLCLAAAGCATQSTQEMREKASHGVVVIQTDTDALATFDGGAPKQIAKGQDNPFPLSPGEHRVEITHPEFTTRRYDVDVKANEALVLRVQMWPLVEEIDNED